MKSLYAAVTLLFASTSIHASALLNATEMDLMIQVRDRQSNLLLNNHLFESRTAIELPYQCDQFPLRLQATEVGRSINRNSCVLIGRQHCTDNIYILRVTRKDDGSPLFYIEAYPRANRGSISQEIDIELLDSEDVSN